MPVAPGYLYKVKTGRKAFKEDKLALLVALHEVYMKTKDSKTPVTIIESSVPKKDPAIKPKALQPVINIPFKGNKKGMPKGLSIAEQLKWRIENE